MNTIINCNALGMRFKDTDALRDLSVFVGSRKIIGLLGRNGSGKTTLLQTLVGLLVPTSGACEVFGRSSMELSRDDMSRIGFVHQEGGFMDAMKVQGHLDYIGSYYENWDKDREQRLLREFELKPSATVGSLSTGDKQKLGIMLAVCHHPKLLLLDEPASALDPIVRKGLMQLLFQLVEDDDATIVISSHILMDVEKLIDHVWFMREGELVVDQSLDDLKESYACWDVTAKEGSTLPRLFDEEYICEQSGSGNSRTLVVKAGAAELEVFCERYVVVASSRSMNLESLFTFFSKRRRWCYEG